MLDTERAVRLGLVTLVLVLAAQVAGLADETDNFTCRHRRLSDSARPLDAWVNARIYEAVEHANRRQGCDRACLSRELQRAVGRSVLHPATLVPHSALGLWASRDSDIDRCHLMLRESIYGARPYDQPWLFPVTGRIIFLADSIHLSGHVVGIDKINHFVREGLLHWRAVHHEAADIAVVMAQELGPPKRQLGMNEHGLKGLSLTGVVSYADLAASYSGFRFWTDLLSIGGRDSFVDHDTTRGRFAVRREFTFAAYVNASWDEGINHGSYDPALAREVDAALRARGLTAPLSDCRALAVLPQAHLYVNPSCLRVWGSRPPCSTPGPGRHSQQLVGLHVEPAEVGVRRRARRRTSRVGRAQLERNHHLQTRIETELRDERGDRLVPHLELGLKNAAGRHLDPRPAFGRYVCAAVCPAPQQRRSHLFDEAEFPDLVSPAAARVLVLDLEARLIRRLKKRDGEQRIEHRRHVGMTVSGDVVCSSVRIVEAPQEQLVQSRFAAGQRRVIQVRHVAEHEQVAIRAWIPHQKELGTDRALLRLREAEILLRDDVRQAVHEAVHVVGHRARHAGRRRLCIDSGGGHGRNGGQQREPT
jgi:hypothetical protein